VNANETATKRGRTSTLPVAQTQHDGLSIKPGGGGRGAGACCTRAERRRVDHGGSDLLGQAPTTAAIWPLLPTWRFSVGALGAGSNPAIGADGTVYVAQLVDVSGGTIRANLTALSPVGAVLWRSGFAPVPAPASAGVGVCTLVLGDQLASLAIAASIVTLNISTHSAGWADTSGAHVTPPGALQHCQHWPAAN
jgi:hypothetical protein